jgi:hypothetical protein
MNGGGGENERFESEVSPCSRQGSIWGMEVGLQSFLPSALDGGEGSTSRSARSKN